MQGGDTVSYSVTASKPIKINLAPETLTEEILKKHRAAVSQFWDFGKFS